MPAAFVRRDGHVLERAAQRPRDASENRVKVGNQPYAEYSVAVLDHVSAGAI